MNNNDLKIKFDEIQKKITDAKHTNIDVKPLLEEKYNLLKQGFDKIKEATSGAEFDKNPKKYSTLLSYLNSMKETAQEVGKSTLEVEALKDLVVAEMKKNNLEWLLNE